MKTAFIVFFALLISAIISSAEPQPDNFLDIRAIATQMGGTSEGKAYEKRFSKVFANPMDEAIRDCTKNIKPPYVVNVVFIIGADGTVERILSAPGELISEGVAIKLKGLKVPRPPKPSWMVSVSMEINKLEVHRDISEDLPPPSRTQSPGGR